MLLFPFILWAVAVLFLFLFIQIWLICLINHVVWEHRMTYNSSLWIPRTILIRNREFAHTKILITHSKYTCARAHAHVANTINWYYMSRINRNRKKVQIFFKSINIYTNGQSRHPIAISHSGNFSTFFTQSAVCQWLEQLSPFSIQMLVISVEVIFVSFSKEISQVAHANANFESSNYCDEIFFLQIIILGAL